MSLPTCCKAVTDSLLSQQSSYALAVSIASGPKSWGKADHNPQRKEVCVSTVGKTLPLLCFLGCLRGQPPSVVKSTQTWPRYAGPFVTCSRKLSYSTTKGEQLCVISSWLHQSGGKPHWAGHPKLVISNHRACQDSISLTANWTNANEAGKTSFLLWREKPSQTGKKKREKLCVCMHVCVCLRDNERAMLCVCVCVYVVGVCVDFSCKSQGCSGLTLPLSP